MPSLLSTSCIVRPNPFIDDPTWYYTLHMPSIRRNNSTDNPPPPPSLTINLNFGTQTISSLRTYADEHKLQSTTETKSFTFDICEFNHQFSAEQVINSIFMNTSTGRDMPIERRQWLVTDISELITTFVRDDICVDSDEILITLDVVEMAQDDEEYLNGILQESFEDHVDHLSACPAPQALLDCMVTEVFREEEEEVNCVICLEEIVVGTVIKRLPCSHRFHGDCIDGWFAQSDSCPLCRFTLEDEELDS